MRHLIPIALACLLAAPSTRADTVSTWLENISFSFSAGGVPIPGSPGNSYADTRAHFDAGSDCGDPYPWPSGCSGPSFHLDGVDLDGSWISASDPALRADARITRPGTAYDFLVFQYTFFTADNWYDAIVLDPGVSVTLSADMGASFDDGAAASGYALAIGLLSLHEVFQSDDVIDSLTLQPGDAAGRLSVTYTNGSDHRIGVSWEAQLEIHGVASLVPEPGTAATLLLGAGAFAAWRFDKRSRLRKQESLASR